MFGRKDKKQEQIDVLEARITALASKVAENNHDLGELKGRIISLEQENENLLKELAAVGERQQTFRMKLIEVADDHTHSDERGLPSTVAGCVQCNRKKGEQDA